MLAQQLENGNRYWHYIYWATNRARPIDFLEMGILSPGGCSDSYRFDRLRIKFMIISSRSVHFGPVTVCHFKGRWIEASEASELKT